MDDDRWLNIQQKLDQLGVDPDNLLDIIQNKKVTPMLRGMNLEKTLFCFLVQHGLKPSHLPEDQGDIKCGRLICECKMGDRGNAKFDKKMKTWKLEVKCHQSRSKQTKAVDKLALDLNVPVEVAQCHHDSYHYTDFDIVVCNLGNCFWQRGDDVFNPTRDQLKFLDSIGVVGHKEANRLLFYARAKDLASSPEMPCRRKKCPNPHGCGFIPNHPRVFFKPGSKTPEPPWKPLSEILNEEGIRTEKGTLLEHVQGNQTQIEQVEFPVPLPRREILCKETHSPENTRAQFLL